MFVFTDEKELSEINEPIPVSGSGGHLDDAERIPYQLTLAKDHPKGEVPITIKDDDKNLTKFKEVLELVKNEKQVLILVKSMISDIKGDSFDNKSITDQLPKNSYTEHHFQKLNNNSAAAWFEHHMTSLKKWELRGLAEEQTEAGEPCEDRFVADPENATMSVFAALDLCEFWSRITSRPLPTPEVTFLT